MRAVVLGIRVVAGEQVFEHLAEEFRVERDFFFYRGVFLDGELVTLEDFQQAAWFVFAVFGLIDVIEVHTLLAVGEEQFVGYVERVFRSLGKTIDAQHGLAAFLHRQVSQGGVAFEVALRNQLVQAFEQAAVEKWHLTE